MCGLHPQHLSQTPFCPNEMMQEWGSQERRGEAQHSSASYQEQIAKNKPPRSRPPCPPVRINPPDLKRGRTARAAACAADKWRWGLRSGGSLKYTSRAGPYGAGGNREVPLGARGLFGLGGLPNGGGVGHPTCEVQIFLNSARTKLGNAKKKPRVPILLAPGTRHGSIYPGNGR